MIQINEITFARRLLGPIVTNDIEHIGIVEFKDKI